MAACGEPGEDAALYAAVQAVGMELCPALGIAIPVGKDSLSMKTQWRDGAAQKSVVAPVSLIVSAFAPVDDVRRTLTPQLRMDAGATRLLWVDLGRGQVPAGRLHPGAGLWTAGRRAAGPRLRRNCCIGFAAALRAVRATDHVLAYHDISDGGLLATLAEMAFAGHCGIDAQLPAGGADLAARLFAEELGAVLQVRTDDVPQVLAVFAAHGLGDCVHDIGAPTIGDAPAGRLRQRDTSQPGGRSCAARGARPRTRCACCATIRPARGRNLPRSWTKRIRACPCISPLTRSRISPRPM